MAVLTAFSCSQELLRISLLCRLFPAILDIRKQAGKNSKKVRKIAGTDALPALLRRSMMKEEKLTGYEDLDRKSGSSGY